MAKLWLLFKLFQAFSKKTLLYPFALHFTIYVLLFRRCSYFSFCFCFEHFTKAISIEGWQWWYTFVWRPCTHIYKDFVSNQMHIVNGIMLSTAIKIKFAKCNNCKRYYYNWVRICVYIKYVLGHEFPRKQPCYSNPDGKQRRGHLRREPIGCSTQYVRLFVPICFRRMVFKTAWYTWHSPYCITSSFYCIFIVLLVLFLLHFHCIHCIFIASSIRYLHCQCVSKNNECGERQRWSLIHYS